jgi:transposase-like protein
MQYHRNATTNVNQRVEIQASKLTSRELEQRFGVSHVTCAKWKNADHVEDKSHKPDLIHYAVPRPFWKLIKEVREQFKLPLDDLFFVLQDYVPNLKRGNCYRILHHYGLNRLSTKEKREYKKFATYPPGYLHIDSFELPRFNGKKTYVYIAVDRATKLLFVRIYANRSKYEAADFLIQALNFFPYRIHHILTDNGREYTMRNQLSFGKKSTGSVPFELICDFAGIEQRQTKPYHPWTNGMAERMVRTIKEHTIKIEDYKNVNEAIISVYQFQYIHNFQLRTKRLNHQTPYEVTMDWFSKEPNLFLKHPNELLTIR